MQTLHKFGVTWLCRCIQNDKPLLSNKLSCLKHQRPICQMPVTAETLRSKYRGAFPERSRNKQFRYVFVDVLSRIYCTLSEQRNCWKCGAALLTSPAFFCKDCEVVQSPDQNVTYFDIMECDRSFAVDIQKLQQRYLHLQRSLHPDNFSKKSEKEQEYSETQSALVNKAYRTLLKPLSRGLYLLELVGMHLEEGTDGAADPKFLQEVMELNERLAEAHNTEEASGIGHSIRDKLEDLTEQINSSFHKGDLQKAKVLLAQMMYFVNVEEKVKDKLSQSM